MKTSKDQARLLEWVTAAHKAVRDDEVCHPTLRDRRSNTVTLWTGELSGLKQGLEHGRFDADGLRHVAVVTNYILRELACTDEQNTTRRRLEEAERRARWPQHFGTEVVS